MKLGYKTWYVDRIYIDGGLKKYKSKNGQYLIFQNDKSNRQCLQGSNFRTLGLKTKWTWKWLQNELKWLTKAWEDITI